METTFDPTSVWNRFAHHYDEVIPLARCYRRLVDHVAKACQGADLVIDAGCGTGLIAFDLLKRGHFVMGFDKSPMMLERAYLRQRSLAAPDRARLVLCEGDVVEWPSAAPENAGAVVMNNVLFCVKDVPAALKAAYDHLVEGGRIAVSGPKRKPNLQHIFDSIVRDMKAEGILTESLLHSLTVTFDFQKSVASQDEMPSVHQLTEIESLLRGAGFRRVLAASDEEYYGESFFIAMEK